MQTQFDTLPKDKQILVYCYSGQTAGQTVAILKLLGYDAASIKSGMGTPVTGGSGWANECFDVVL
jgi:rhodanese-related sulfurtransferase